LFAIIGTQNELNQYKEITMSNHAVGTLAQLASRLPAGIGGNSRSASVSASGKGRKKGSQNKKALQRCQQQVATCEAVFTTQCAGDQDCIAKVARCCPLLSTCDFSGLLACI
jgi:hypothetical protein